jgi:two-component system, OmpR family, alkaline phosphatase synthesis response regulator PhoP
MSGKVLIADDEPSIVISLEFLMQRSGYEVCVARDGEEAQRLIESFRPDVVLLDAMMPRRSGIEVCRWMRETPELRAARVVMLSAKGRQGDEDEGYRAGADVYVTKPFSTSALVATVRQLMGHGGAS